MKFGLLSLLFLFSLQSFAKNDVILFVMTDGKANQINKDDLLSFEALRDSVTELTQNSGRNLTAQLADIKSLPEFVVNNLKENEKL